MFAPPNPVADRHLIPLPPIPPQHPEVYLDKTHNWLLEGVPYVDRVKYAEAQPEKPKRGFGTSDYSKRDEFSMDFRTEQMREALKSEARHQAIASEKAKAAMEKELAASGYTKGYRGERRSGRRI